MRPDRKTARMAQIEDAAYALIQEKGFIGASMLGVAKRAKASNETLYNWYGDKLGLFRAMVESNAIQVRETLKTASEADTPPLDILAAIGPVLLAILTGERAVALNRVAAADKTGDLGKALAQAGRNTVAPLIGQTLERARKAKLLAFDDTRFATDLYLGLLIGDLQLRCVTGQIPAPDDAQRQQRAARALDILKIVLKP